MTKIKLQRRNTCNPDSFLNPVQTISEHNVNTFLNMMIASSFNLFFILLL